MKAVLIGYAVCSALGALFWAGRAKLAARRERQKALAEKPAALATSPIPEITTEPTDGMEPRHVREIGELEPVDDALRGTF